METKHEHEPIISLGNLIRCRTCGQILSSMKEVISKVQSSTRARRILEEIAVAGKYKAIEFRGSFVVYSRNKDGLIEEVTAKKIGDREFEVVKRTITVEEG